MRQNWLENEQIFAILNRENVPISLLHVKKIGKYLGKKKKTVLLEEK